MEEDTAGPARGCKEWLKKVISKDEACQLESALADGLLQEERLQHIAVLLCAHYASSNCFKVLMQHNFPLDFHGNSGRSPLHVAAENPSGVFVQPLIEAARASYSQERFQAFIDMLTKPTRYQTWSSDNGAGAAVAINWNTIASHGTYVTALNQAVCVGNEACVRQLLQAGADPNLPGHPHNLTAPSPLANAAESHLDIVKELIAYGADVNAFSDQGTSPLMSATRVGARDIVEVLIKAGAAVNSSPKTETPLMVALELGLKHLAELLLQDGADIMARDPSNNSVVYYAVMADSLSLLEFILQRLPKIFKPDDRSLHMACDRGNPIIAKRLISFGWDVRKRDHLGYTCLKAAVPDFKLIGRMNGFKHDKDVVLEIVLDEFCRVASAEEVTQETSTALAHAVVGGSSAAIDLLLSHSADPSLTVSVLTLEESLSCSSLIAAWLMVGPSVFVEARSIERSERLCNLCLLIQTGCDVNVTFRRGHHSPCDLTLLEHSLGARALTVAMMLWEAGAVVRPDSAEVDSAVYMTPWQGQTMTVARNEDMTAFIQNTLSQPRSLTSITAIALRRHLYSCRQMQHVPQLQLPYNLHDLLLLKHLNAIVNSDSERMHRIQIALPGDMDAEPAPEDDGSDFSGPEYLFEEYSSSSSDGSMFTDMESGSDNQEDQEMVDDHQ